MLQSLRRALLGAVVILTLLPLPVSGAELPVGKLEKIRVPSPALANNLQGNDATRDVHVYLPPG
jgi:hypothetical protein